MPSQNIHFLNGKLVEEKDLTVSVRDLGFSRGYAVFDFLITYPHHRPFMLDLHIDRLFNSANLLGLDVPWTKNQIKNWVAQTLAANNGKGEKSIRIIISGGVADSLIPEPNATTIAIQIDDRHYLPASYYENGVGILMAKHNRYIPGAKSNNYIEGVIQAKAAKKINALEPVYYSDEQVFEGATSNIFAVINGKLMTPKSNILPGITREVLLKILKLNIPIEIADFKMGDLLSATEVFLTASNKEVLPVTKINGAIVGNGKVGDVTKEAMRQFTEYALEPPL